MDVVKSRRHRSWTKTHEPLMEKLLELCVDLRKSQIAKDGLHQYKTIVQQVSFCSAKNCFHEKDLKLFFFSLGLSQIIGGCHREIS